MSDGTQTQQTRDQTYSMQCESHHLLNKRTRQQLAFGEIIICAMVATLGYAVVYISMCFSLRYEDVYLAYILGPLPLALIAIGLLPVAVVRLRRSRSSRALFAMSICLGVAVYLGFTSGNSNFMNHTSYFYNFRDMASYVNVDPATDGGQGFMDAGTVYFKEGTYVLRKKALGFHNGKTYCVAPLVRAPLQMDSDSQSNGFQLPSVTGYSLPKAGTIDFWAVGTDCCGETGTDGAGFTCGDSMSQVARAGMRLLNTAEREMYLLAVQQWSADIGLPVRHPLFFTWVKDPLKTTKTFYNEAWHQFWLNLVMMFFIALILSFLVHATYKWFNIH